MIKTTVVKEESRNTAYGYVEIKWRCGGCGHIISLPQQQSFNYCLHCGRKVVVKIGGKVDI